MGFRSHARSPRRNEIIPARAGSVTAEKIAEFLKQQGYPRVVNLAGGIIAWADEIDPKMQKY